MLKDICKRRFHIIVRDEGQMKMRNYENNQQDALYRLTFKNPTSYI